MRTHACTSGLLLQQYSQSQLFLGPRTGDGQSKYSRHITRKMAKRSHHMITFFLITGKAFTISNSHFAINQLIFLYDKNKKILQYINANQFNYNAILYSRLFPLRSVMRWSGSGQPAWAPEAKQASKRGQVRVSRQHTQLVLCSKIFSLVFRLGRTGPSMPAELFSSRSSFN